MYAPGVPLVDVIRSGVVESRHTGHVIVLDADGTPVRALGETERPVFTRSANKPLQAVGMLRLGLPLDGPDLAIATASHSGEPAHLDAVQRVLAAAGVGEDSLGCPPDLPLNDDAKRGERRRLFMNCSGKHAAMLLTCRVNGWPIDDYLSPDHPLQVSLREIAGELTGHPIETVGVDGCGAPVFALPLAGLAAAYLHLVHATDGVEARVAAAMRAHPHLVAGTGRMDTTLMSAVPGLLAKGGAEGVHAIALPGVGAVAVKIDDGAGRAAERAAVRGLALLRAEGLEGLTSAPVLGGGRPVGEIRATF